MNVPFALPGEVAQQVAVLLLGRGVLFGGTGGAVRLLQDLFEVVDELSGLGGGGFGNPVAVGVIGERDTGHTLLQ